METLDDLINEATDARETKRALAVKMSQKGQAPQEIAAILNVSEQYISKWKSRYQTAGAVGLRLAYRGKRPYLSSSQRQQVVRWIASHDSLRLAEVRDHIDHEYGVIYESKQSYYDLLSEGGMSYHQTTATNPKYDEAQVMEKREAIKKKWRNIKPK